ncbi:hypothetical protein GCM10022252_20030 [Streptosporangium oxazolinicum]|uniref:Lsr2 family protein n=1 Tax=Streptosporangium oxazolinicum TaxID=909287 RepID=A0ABP8ANV4_9ACTN
MATKVIIVCDWHETDAAATHHNEWTNLKGERKQNDLCDDHQLTFTKAWDTVESNSSLVTEPVPAPKTRRRRTPKETPSDAALARAWARGRNMEVSQTGKVGYQVEQAWKKAGKPNVLENPGSTKV